MSVQISILTSFFPRLQLGKIIGKVFRVKFNYPFCPACEIICNFVMKARVIYNNKFEEKHLE